MRNGWLIVFSIAFPTLACSTSRPEAPAADVDANLLDASLDSATDSSAPLDDSPTRCVCCGAPFVASLEDYTADVLTTSSGDGFAVGTVRTDAGWGPTWFAHIDARGKPISRRSYDDEDGELGQVVELASGGFALLGGGVSGSPRRLIRMDAEGTKLWSKMLGEGKESFESVRIASTNKRIIATGSYRYQRSPYSVSSQGWVGRYDLNGELLREISDTSILYWQWLSARGGKVAMCGTRADGLSECLVETEDGASVWRRPVPLDWRVHAIALTGDGSLYVAGAKDSPGGKVFYTQPTTLRVAKLNPAGAVVWEQQRAWTKLADFEVAAIVETPDGGFALTGSMRDLTYPPGVWVPPTALTQYWLAAGGDSSGKIAWAKGYAPTGTGATQGRRAAVCTSGVLLMGWNLIIRTDANGVAPIMPPGSVIDL